MNGLSIDKTNFREVAKELIFVYEKNGELYAAMIWERIVNLYEVKLEQCKACSIEAEFGTQEDPHPIASKFHKCGR